MINHANTYEVENVITEIPKVSGARLIAALMTFIGRPNASFVLPFDVNDKQYSVGQGAERMVIYGRIIEELGRRLDAR